MTKAKYQLLPASDHTPALEVSLQLATTSNTNENSSTAVFTELNLNDNNSNVENTNVNIIPVSQTNEFNLLPPASELPSYNEALRLKSQEANPTDLPPGYFTSNENNETRYPIVETVDLRAFTEGTDLANYDQDIGSECMFLSAFMIAFFFNWIGFFASICLLPNAAGKYGALSGFGLSMAKWVTIVRYQEWMANMNDFQQKLFVWLFIFLGFYLFFRGLINYMTLKYRPMAHAEYTRNARNRWFTFMD